MPGEEQRKRVEAEVHIDLTHKSDEHLLADIHDESVNAMGEHAPTTRTLARFGSLLTVLSKRAEASSKRLEDFTKTLVRLTWALFFLGFATLIAVGFQIYLMYHPPK